MRAMPEVDPDNESTFHVCVVKSDLKACRVPKDRILRELEKHQFSEEATFAVKLALEEALCNAVKHGNQGDPGKSVTVRYAVTAEKAVVLVRDEGEGFEPDSVPDPTTDDRLAMPNGRGIMLIAAYMDEVAYRDNGREVYFMKRRQ